MSKRLATTLAKKLVLIDKKIDRLFCDDGRVVVNPPKLEDLEAQAAELVKQASKKGLKMVAIPTRDGYSYYYESNRTSRLVTFEWFYGGGDGYVSPWGKIVCVPIPQANKMIKSFNPKDF